MHEIKKTGWPVICLIWVVCFLLAGCTISLNMERETEPVLPEDTGEKVTLKWIMEGDPSTAGTQQVMEEVNEYLQEVLHANLEISLFKAGDEYNIEISRILAAGEEADIIYIPDTIPEKELSGLAEYYTQLNVYLEKYPAISEVLGEAFLKGAGVNGKIFALPANKEKAHHWGLFLRRDLVTRYEMETDGIHTLEDMEPLFDLLMDHESGVTPLLISDGDTPFHLLDWDYVYGEELPGAFYPDNRKPDIVNQFLEPESIICYGIIRDWVNKGYIHQDMAEYQSKYDLMKSGKYFAVIQSVTPGKNTEINRATDMGWLQVDMTTPVVSNREAKDSRLAIPATSQYKERAFRFIELLYTDAKLKNMLSFGLEEVHYSKTSAQMIRWINPENSRYNPGFELKIGDCFKNYPVEGEDPLKWETIRAYNDSARYLDSLGFVFEPGDYDIHITACHNVVRAYMRDLLSGTADVASTIEQFREELKIAGVDELISEIQRQYDEWRSQ